MIFFATTCTGPLHGFFCSQHVEEYIDLELTTISKDFIRSSIVLLAKYQ